MAVDTANGALRNPFELPDSDGYEWVKGNLHSHTTNSDGRVDPQTRVDGYVGAGYDYLCLSDHRKITRGDTVEAPDGFVLVQGVELHPDNPFGGQRHHFVCLGMEEDMDADVMPPQLVIDRVRSQGGQVWLAHPHWSSVNIARDTMPLDGFSGIEVFNTVCRCMGRGESSVHWDDWMEQEQKLYPMLCNDALHGDPENPKKGRYDWYQGWTMARVKERTSEAVLEALSSGATYGSTGPTIEHISLSKSGDEVEATVKCSEAQRIFAVSDKTGAEYQEKGEIFTEATFPVRPGAQWVRFEVVGPNGAKAWSNPFDLTEL